MSSVQQNSRIQDLEDRLAMLEAHAAGSVRPQFTEETLVSLHGVACSAAPPTAESTVLWKGVFAAIGVEDLRRLSLLLRNPFPWVPFLDVALRHRDQELVARVRKLARGLLDAQGLGLVPIDEVAPPLHAS